MEIATVPSPIEDKCSQLIGKTVSQVIYTESEQPLFTDPGCKANHPGVHRVNRSVRLAIADSTAIEFSWNRINIYWDEEFLHYGLQAKLVHLSDPVGEPACNVSAVDFWQEIVGQTITGFAISYQKTWVESPKSRVHMDFSYPQTIAVHFSNQRSVFISVAEYQPGHRHTVVRGISHLLVTTNAELLGKAV